MYYTKAVFAFTYFPACKSPSKGVACNKKADERLWRPMLQFLKEAFGEM